MVQGSGFKVQGSMFTVHVSRLTFHGWCDWRDWL